MIRSNKISLLFLLLGLSIPSILASVHYVNSRSGSLVGKKIETERVLIIPVPEYIGCINPQYALTALEKSMMLQTYSRLVKPSPSLSIEADLAESWSYDIDQRTLQFKLRKGVDFHDGLPVTTDDILFSFHEWAKKEALDSELLLPILGVEEFRNGKASSISGLRALDEQNFQVVLTHWTDQLVKNLAMQRFVIYPKHYRNMKKEDFYKHPIATGPYRLLESNPNGGTYHRFDGYHFGRPMTEVLKIKVMDYNTAKKAYLKGEVNNLLFYSVTEAEVINAKDSCSLDEKNKSTFVMIIALNDAVTRNPAFRRYVASLIDRDALLVNADPCVTPSYHLIPPGVMGSHSGLQKQTALNYFDAAIEFQDHIKKSCIYIDEISHLHNPNLLLKDYFNKLGFYSKIVGLNELFEMLQNKSLKLWVEEFKPKTDDPMSILQYFSQKSNEYLLGDFIPELESIFDDLAKELTTQQRAQKYQQIEDYLISHHLVIPLIHTKGKVVFKQKLKGVDFFITGRYISDWHKIYAEK